MSLGYNSPGYRRRNPSNNSTLLIVGVLGVGYYGYTQGWFKGLLGGGGGGGGSGGSTDQCALAVSTHRPDLCAYITAGSGGLYNCQTQASTAALVRHWWDVMNPPEKQQYSSLCAYAQAMGWA